MLIAAPASHQGKTTVTLGLLRALCKRGLAVQPFKCGPDYLDTYHHNTASGESSINLDLFLSSQKHIEDLYIRYTSQKKVAIAEGVMGLFDGSRDDSDSSAALAKLLKIPVILVVDARAMAFSVGALLFGFKNFDKEVNVAGVIFNFVKSDSHYQFLSRACERVGVRPLGYLPPNEEIKLPSRYLGLNIDKRIETDKVIEKIALHVEKNLDIDALLQLTQQLVSREEKIVESPSISKKGVIAVAKDEAFNFLYQENLKALSKLGEITYFSPLSDTQLPKADLLYFAGGYPELYLHKLASNYSMMQAVKNYCEKGGKVLAECGGMMYLGNNIIDAKGEAHPLVGYLPITSSMAKKKLNLGYRHFQWNDLVAKGHEFHYSQLIEEGNLQQVGILQNARTQPVATKVYRKKNVLASYVHFYWGDNVSFLKHLVNLN